MDYEDGASLAQLLEEHGTLSEPQLRRVLMPVVDGLRAVHAAGFLHRDIKPSNIYVRRTDESPVLLDFGAARQALGHRSRSLTGIITAGYSPPEQYERDGNQGPWSDIYALSALCYRASTGQAPVDVLDRQREVFRHRRPDPLPMLADSPPTGYSRSFADAVDWGLQLSETDRPQTLDAWVARLDARDEHPERSANSTERQPRPPPVSRLASTARKWLMMVSAMAIAVVGIVLVQSMERDVLPTIEPAEGDQSADRKAETIVQKDAGAQVDGPSDVERTSTETATRNDDDGSWPELDATNAASEGVPQHDNGDTDRNPEVGLQKDTGRQATPPAVEPTSSESVPGDVDADSAAELEVKNAVTEGVLQHDIGDADRNPEIGAQKVASDQTAHPTIEPSSTETSVRDEHGGAPPNSGSRSALPRAADTGDAESQYRLGVSYANGDGVPQDHAKAVAWFRKAAEQGHAVAQLNLGVMYFRGEGVRQDDAEAAAWFRKAAAQESAEAQSRLGFLYVMGRGVPQSYADGVSWTRKSAELGFADAQLMLGGMYAEGIGVPQVLAEAVAWYQKAANQGNAFAQYNLGVIYADGEGVLQDYAKAVASFGKAAEQGNVQAQFSLGVMYYNGEGVTQNYGEAAVWLRQAAEQGYARAQSLLGNIYVEGRGVRRDYVRAYAWFNLSISRGMESARNQRDRVGRRMTPAQISEAQALSSQLDRRIPYL